MDITPFSMGIAVEGFQHFKVDNWVGNPEFGPISQ
jgi:hypothetical protein